MKELKVFLYGKELGVIKENNNKIFFDCSKNWDLNTINPSPLILDSVEKIYTNETVKRWEGLMGLFQDSLPDEYGMKIIK